MTASTESARITRRDWPRAAAFLLAGCGVVLAFAVFGLNGSGLVAALDIGVLVVLAWVDFDRRLLPNRIVLPSAAFVFAAQVALAPGHALELGAYALGTALVLLLAYLVYPAGLGLGDVKLGLLLGASLGGAVVLGLLVGTLAAAAAAVAVLIREGSAGRKASLPLGTFLAFGAIVALFVAQPPLAG
ncbi:MAG TPA: prepilin peptidase [Gaiellaceae bacterium]|nr:prepilin peptidase [Gaiellaceae bacterium]